MGKRTLVGTPPKHRIVEELLARHGRTFSDEAGISLRDTPAPLFQLLVLSILLSARIDAAIAVSATRAIIDQGWTTPEKVSSSSWEERAATLNEAGYARYDERTARMLADTTETLIDEYDGDLRMLRERADHDPDTERRLIQQFSGIGEVGAAIFSREVQLVWEEMFPFADERALRCADRLELGDEITALQRYTEDQNELTRLVAALVRCDLAGDHDEVLDAARG